MENLQLIIAALMVMVITLSGVTALALWRIRHGAGRLGSHIIALLLSLMILFCLHLWGRLDINAAAMPVNFEVTRIIGISVVMAALSALCLFLLGLKNGKGK